MPVALTTATALGQYALLPILSNLKELFARVGIASHSAEGHLDNLVFAIATERTLATARLAIFGKDVTGKFEVDEGPELTIAAHNDVTTTSAIATIGSAFLDILHVPKVSRASATMT